MEAAEHFGGEEAGADDFEGDGTAGGILLGFVDGAHAALTDEAEDLVFADLFWEGLWRGGGVTGEKRLITREGREAGDVGVGEGDARGDERD